jgi:rubrerythrin
MDNSDYHKKALIHVLQMAYSGERAAGYAYNAHWRTLKHIEQRQQIQKIENEEWSHREIVGKMLAHLGGKPQIWREYMMAIIGRTVGFACYVIGWFLPMYFAGRLESANVKEYEVASYHAERLDLSQFAEELLRLSAVEKEHELFFSEMVKGHPFLPAVRTVWKWGPSSSAKQVSTK